MSKYDPLRRHLLARVTTEVPLSFREVEDVLGFALPDSARKYPAWWSNNTGTHVGVSAWRDAGWKTSRVDIGAERVTFVRDPAHGPAWSTVSGATQFADGEDAAVHAGVSEGPRGFDEIALAPSRLSRSALAMIDDLAEEMGDDRAAAVTAILEASASERRRRMLADLPVARLPTGHDSTALIREDRDAR
jgi:hypothetical protein